MLKSFFSTEKQYRIFLVLCLSTLLNFALVGYRLLHTGFDFGQINEFYDLAMTRSTTFLFLVWNLFLALVPYLLSLLLPKLPKRWLAAPLLIVWLVFLPNAPYIVTDLMHLSRRTDQWLYWYDVVMVVVLAWTGCLLGATSLGIMQGIVARYLGRMASWLFVLGSAGLCGIGIYVGRFQRWNSWDVLFNPLALVRDLAAVFGQPRLDPYPWALCALFAAFVLMSYITLVAARNALTASGEQRG